MTVNNKPTILIVDDHEQNLRLIASSIKHLNCRMLFATDGAEALNAVSNNKPQLILLDIMMPEVDGFDVCQALKKDPSTSDIPIIFITAKIEAEDIAKAFSYGAADYITKPFIREELIARVELQLKLNRAQRELQQSNTELSIKNEQLELANSQKDEYVAMVAHDLKNPLAAIVNRCDYMLRMSQEKLLARLKGSLQTMQKSANNMLAEIQKTLESQAINYKRESNVERFDLLAVIKDVININRINAERKNITIQFEQQQMGGANAFEFTIRSKASNIREVADNLISNAVKYSPANTVVTVSLELQGTDPNRWQLSIADCGPGFCQADKAKMFQQFIRLSAQPTAGESSSGLGLYIAKNLADDIGGELILDDSYTNGAKFTLNFSEIANH